MSSKTSKVVSKQTLEDIRKGIPSLCKNGIVEDKELYVDHTFPPDQSSLTYVYSGDDAYERMTFKRPPDMCVSTNLVGVGGVCHIRLPLDRRTDRHWLLYSLAVVSLNTNYMEKLIPGYTDFRQGFHKNYIGAFAFELWQFGDWVEVVVDDYLPIIDGRFAFCAPLGTPPEFWGPLVEKAYAKCYKVYEAIETGNILDAITDLSGAVCEHYQPHSTSRDTLFHIMYKSCVNRSLIVCWRNEQGPKQMDFLKGNKSLMDCRSSCETEFPDERELDLTPQYLYLVTAATKFPLKDGSMVLMIRIKFPYLLITDWDVPFNPSDEENWFKVHPTFMINYRPKQSLERNETWIPFEDFCSHFTDLVLCSSTDPYTGIDNDSERKYKSDVSTECNNWSESIAKDNQISKRNGGERIARTDTLNVPDSFLKKIKRNSVEILVHESRGAVKSDTSQCSESHNIPRSYYCPFEHDSRCPVNYETERHQINYRHTKNRGNSLRDELLFAPSSGRSSFSSGRSSLSGQGEVSNHKGILFMKSNLLDNRLTASVHSNISNCGQESECESTYSSSDIDLVIAGSERRGPNSINLGRPKSASLKYETMNRCSSGHSDVGPVGLFEARMDYFRSRGSWTEIVYYYGRWKGTRCGGPRSNMKMHSLNPRVPFAIAKADAVNEIIALQNHGKSHVVISVMQDYRLGSESHNSLFARLGFCIYKSKHPDKDEKRILAKLSLIADVGSPSESREITARFDLDPGYYYLVPYTMELGHEAGFLVRILGDKDQVKYADVPLPSIRTAQTPGVAILYTGRSAQINIKDVKKHTPFKLVVAWLYLFSTDKQRLKTRQISTKMGESLQLKGV